MRIVAADINPGYLVAASDIADAFEQVPPASDLAFPGILAAGMKRHDVDTYAPILDSEIVLGAEMSADGRIPPSVIVLAPSADVAAACLDKLETGRRLAAAGLPSPQTQPVNTARWEPSGMLVKPRSGVGSVGVRIVRSEAEFNALRADANLIAQEICFGPEVTIDTFRARNHDVFDGDTFQIKQVEQDRLVLPRNKMARFEHQGSEFFRRHALFFWVSLNF